MPFLFRLIRFLILSLTLLLVEWTILTKTYSSWSFNRITGNSFRTRNLRLVTIDDLRNTKEPLEFAKYFSALSPELKKRHATDILDEIDFRLNSLDIRSIVHIVYSFTSFPIPENDIRINGIVMDAFTKITRALQDGGFQETSPKPISQFLQGLVASQRLNWKRLSNRDKNIFLSQVQEYMTACTSEEWDPSHFKHINDILISIGKLNSNIQTDTSQDFMNAFFSYIKVQIDTKHTSTAKIVLVVSSFHIIWTKLPEEIQRLLLANIERDVAMMDQNGFVRLLSALAKMKFILPKSSRSFQSVLISVMNSQIAVLGERNICQLLQALGKLKYKWSYLSSYSKKSIEQRLIEISPFFCQGLSAICTALNRLDVDWYELSPNTREAVLTSIPKYEEVSEQVISNVIYSLAGMNVQWKDLSKDYQEVLVSSLDFVSKRLTAQGLSNTLWGLSKMGFSGISPELESTIQSVLPTAEDQVVSTVILALSKLDFKTSKRTDEITKLAANRIFKFEGVSEQSVSNTLLGFARMSYVLTDFSPNFKDSVFTAVNTISPSMTPQAISNILYSLSKIEFLWGSIPISTQILIEDSLIKLAKSLNCVGISTVLYALGKMNAFDLNDEVKRMLIYEVQLKSINMTGLELANSVYGLGLLFSDIDDNLKTRLVMSTSKICKTMTEQELGNTIWGLGQIGLNFNFVPESVLAPIYDRIVHLETAFQRQAIVAILQGLSRFGNLHWDCIPEHTQQSLLRACTTELCRRIDTAENAKLAAVTLRSLGRLQVSWESRTLPMDFKNVLRESIHGVLKCSTETSNETLGYVVSNVINGLCRMKINWKSIEGFIGNLLEVSIPSMSSNELANILWSLGNRRTANSDLRQAGILIILINRFSVLIEDMSSYEFSWSMWAFAKMNFEWYSDFSTEVRYSIISSAENKASTMTKQEVGVLLWALVKLQAPSSEYTSGLKTIFVDNVELILTRNRAKKAQKNY